MTLPPLPMPNVEVISGHRAPFVSYDADQMREYGQQCREEVLEFVMGLIKINQQCQEMIKDLK